MSLLPVTPTTINTSTGAGVPGGYTAASSVSPAEATAHANSNLSAISAKQAELAKAAKGPNPPPGLAKSQAKLKGLQTKYSNKAKAAAKAPDFKSKAKLPTPPKPPASPDFKAMGIPDTPKVPAAPVAPVTPTVPTTPKIPSLGG